MKRPDGVHEEEELDEGSLSSGEDDDARREIGEQEARRFSAFRKDREDFDKKAEADGQAGKPGTEAAPSGPGSPAASPARIEGKAPTAPAAPVAPTSGPQAPTAPRLGAVSPVTTNAAQATAAASIEHLLTAEMQKSARSDPKRSIHGAPLQKTPSSPTKTEAPAAPSTLKAPATARPLESAAAPRRPAPPPPAPASSRAMSVPPTRVDARVLLSTAKPAGTLLNPFALAPSAPAMPPGLPGAVSEVQKQVAGMKGVERVTAGVFKGEPVVLIGVQFGLSREALRALPDKVQDFKTVISLPFDALPLRRPLGNK